MARRMRILVDNTIELFAEMLDDKCPITCEAIWENLPFKIHGALWGDEIYFSIPVELDYENPKKVVRKGDIGYWPSGTAFCIFFGPTPMTKDPDKIVPASSVNVFARLITDPDVLEGVLDGCDVSVTRVDG